MNKTVSTLSGGGTKDTFGNRHKSSDINNRKARRIKEAKERRKEPHKTNNRHLGDGRSVIKD